MNHTEKWQRRFIELAKHVAQWSHDPSTKVGAVIVDKKKIVRGMGYNSFPRGVEDTEERYNNRELKYELVVHAEVNAILNSHGSLDGCTLYVWPTLMNPNCCPNCAKIVAQTGISEIVFEHGEYNERWQKMSELSKMIFVEAGKRYYSI